MGGSDVTFLAFLVTKMNKYAYIIVPFTSCTFQILASSDSMNINKVFILYCPLHAGCPNNQWVCDCVIRYGHFLMPEKRIVVIFGMDVINM